MKLQSSLIPTERSKKEKLLKLAWELRRRFLTENFYEFCIYMDEDFFTPQKKHLRLIAAVYQYVSMELITRVFLSMPPRAGKSYITSLFCAWLIGKDPTGTIMRNSYSGSLASKFSYDIRAIIQMETFLRVFPWVKLKADKRALEDWAITGSVQTSYFCAGVMGALTGKGCDKVSILDDPIKNMEVALSEVQLDNIWNWYQSVHKSRMEKSCPEIHIATRWSKHDPIGRIKEAHGTITFKEFLQNPKDNKNSWVEILIPALDENGETFCSEIKTTEQYREIRLDSDDFIWQALYNQNPVDLKGIVFPASEMLYFEDKEIEKYKDSKDTWDAIVGYTDTADQGGDWLASITGKIKGKYVFITDVVYTLDKIEITEPRVANQIIDQRLNTHTVESNAAGRSFARNIRELIKPFSRCTIREIANQTNKDTRILMKGGQVRTHFKFKKERIPGTDYDKYFKHLTNYVILSGKNDDAADATVGLAESIYDRPVLKAVRRL